MKSNKELLDIQDIICGGNLRQALTALENFSYKYPEMHLAEPLAAIHDDYHLMADFWLRGFQDAQRGEVYHRLLQRAYTLTAHAIRDYEVSHNPYITFISRRVRPVEGQYDAMIDTLQDKLETFVADVAMLDFEPEQSRKSKKKDLYDRHQRLDDDMFNYIWTLGQWKDDVAQTLERIALSPTVDVIDQQLIVTATMLGAINQFDIKKLLMLVNVYRKSSDEQVRQRALVGWVFALDDKFASLYPEEKEIVRNVLTDERVCKELVELQIQLLYCMSAEQDNQTIQANIMPTLLKHNNFHITPHGIEEKEEDRMQNILNPENAERDIEKTEESFKKMMDMQKAGSDIYFGGFSQMKRFPFFDSLSNWFVPFYMDHPGISVLMNHEGTGKFVHDVIGKVPFCNSDKYSFILAFQQVADRIPANMREMMSHGLPGGSDVFSEAERQSATFVRRIYLQDIYRFFRLNASRSIFANPFEEDDNSGYVFFTKKIFSATSLESHFNEIVACLLKRQCYAKAEKLLCNYSEMGKDYQYYMYCGNVLLRDERKLLIGLTASECFTKALSLRPGDMKARACQARAYFYEGRYTDAADAYSLLLEARPDNRNYILAYCVCVTNLEIYDKALSLLFKLNYERPDDVEVSRVLARALMGNGKYEQARKIYDVLLASDSHESEDIINCGYCEWFAGHVKEAVECFVNYIKQRPRQSSDEIVSCCQEEIIDSDKAFILHHGISDVEMKLMVDSVSDAFFMS